MPWSSQFLLITLVLIAAAYDVLYRRIPNWLVASGIAAGLLINTVIFGMHGMKVSLFGLLLAFLIYFPFFVLRGMGAGDVKLMMAIGSVTGPAVWFGIVIATGLAGGVVALAVLLSRKRLAVTLMNTALILSSLLRLRAPYKDHPHLDVSSPAALTMPHAATIALGSISFLVAAQYFGWYR